MRSLPRCQLSDSIRLQRQRDPHLNEHRAGQPSRRRSSPALAQSANPHRDRHTLGPHLPRLLALGASPTSASAHRTAVMPTSEKPAPLLELSRIGRTGHVRKCKLDDAAASRALCGHGDTQLSQANIASMMLTAELVGTTRVKRRPALPRSEAYSQFGTFLPSQLHKHDHIEHLPRMRRIAGWQDHFDNQQSAARIHCLANMAKDRQTPIFAPVVDDMREDVGIRTGRYACKEIAGLYRHPLAHTRCFEQCRCIASRRAVCLTGCRVSPDDKQARPPASCRSRLPRRQWF